MLAAEPRTPGPSGMLDENGDDQDNVAGVVGAIPVVSTPAPEVPIHPRLNGNLSSDRLEMGANAPRHDIADAEPHDPQLGEFRTGVLYARGAITLEDARRRLGLASADTITRALALLNNMKDGLPTNTRSRPLVSPARNGILGQIMEQHPSARSEDKEAQINALREKGSSQTETAAIGEPNGPLLSPMSAVTDLSDPPSDITEPSEITAKLVSSGFF